MNRFIPTDAAGAKSLVPVVYSKAQTAREVVEHIRAYPEQACNTEHALAHTLEFQLANIKQTPYPYSSTTTLSELHSLEPGICTFFIYPRSGSGVVHVEHKEGIFTIVEAIDSDGPI